MLKGNGEWKDGAGEVDGRAYGILESSTCQNALRKSKRH